MLSTCTQNHHQRKNLFKYLIVFPVLGSRHSFTWNYSMQHYFLLPGSLFVDTFLNRSHRVIDPCKGPGETILNNPWSFPYSGGSVYVVVEVTGNVCGTSATVVNDIYFSDLRVIANPPVGLTNAACRFSPTNLVLLCSGMITGLYQHWSFMRTTLSSLEVSPIAPAPIRLHRVETNPIKRCGYENRVFECLSSSLPLTSLVCLLLATRCVEWGILHIPITLYLDEKS